MALNILKLCVGCESVEDLVDWQRTHPSPLPGSARMHVTRMWPRREDEVLDGGSLYWVIKGVILCRQTILALNRVEGADGILRCGLVLDPAVTRTQAAARRPFQGWRYLDPADSPADLRQGSSREDPLPEALARALSEIGLI